MKTKSKIKQCFVITTFVMAALLVFTSCDKDRFSRRSFIYNQPKETITEIDIVYVWNRDIEVLQTISEDEKEAFLNAFDQLIFAPYLLGEPMGIWGTCIRITYENGSYELVNSIWSEYYEHPGESGWFGWKYCTDEARFQELIDKYTRMNSKGFVRGKRNHSPTNWKRSASISTSRSKGSTR